MHERTSIIMHSFHLFLIFSEQGKGGGGGGSSLNLCLLCEKSCLIFQTANRVPSDKLLDTC